MKSTISIIIATCITLAGCAKSPDKIQAIYVSPLQYQSYNCSQIAQEMRRIRRRAQEAFGGQRKESTGDAVAMGVGLLLFWPSLFFFATDNDQKDLIGRLKGELEALESVAIQQDCKSLLEQMEQERKDAEESTES